MGAQPGKYLIVAAAALLISAAPGAGQQTDSRDSVVQKALDQPTTMVITDQPVGDAFNAIAQKTGVGIVMGPEAMNFLPYGAQTRVSVQITDARLRDGITQVCIRLAMDYAPIPGGIEIFPSPPLARLARTATWDELNGLSQLLTTEWRDDDDYDDMGKHIHFQHIAGEHGDNWKQIRKRMKDLLPGIAAGILTQGCADFGWTWRPDGKDLIVLPMMDQIQYQLQQRVSLRYQNRPIVDVLRGLSRQIGVAVTLDPQAGARLPDRVRNSFSLLAENVTGQEAIEQIAMAGGLNYDVTPQGVTLVPNPAAPIPAAPQPAANAQQAPAAQQAAGPPNPAAVPRVQYNLSPSGFDTGGPRSADPVVGKVIMHSPDGKYTYEWFIRASDLSADENDRLNRMRAEAVQTMKATIP